MRQTQGDHLTEMSPTDREQRLKQEAQELLEEAAQLKGKVYDSVGAGHEVRFKSQKVQGFALVHEDAPIHTSLFAVTED